MHIYKEQEAEPSTGLMMPEPAPAASPGSGSSEGSGIEDTADRQVTFCKRCNGLLKKAYELSMLCDAEVALIVFSSRGRLYECSNNSVEETIERYKKANSDTSNASTVAEINAQHYQQEAAKLKQHITYLQNSNRTNICVLKLSTCREGKRSCRMTHVLKERSNYILFYIAKKKEGD